MVNPGRRLERRHILTPLVSSILAAFFTAIPAQADKGPAGDDPEDNYLFVLHSEGITTGPDGAEAGHGLCSNIARGVKPRALMAEVAELAPALSSYQAEVVVDSAVTWLCPQYLRQYIANR